MLKTVPALGFEISDRSAYPSILLVSEASSSISLGTSFSDTCSFGALRIKVTPRLASGTELLFKTTKVRLLFMK